MITDRQVRLLRQKRMEGKTQETAAAKAGMSVRSARKWQSGPLPSQAKPEHRWRTRPDPFDGVWEDEIEPLLRNDPTGKLKATTIIDWLALPQQNGYPTQVIASNKWLPKMVTQNRGGNRVGGGISKMGKPELLATIRDRYRASSKREESRILDEFIPELMSIFSNIDRIIGDIFRVFDHLGSQIGDYCGTSNLRCRDGIPGGSPNGDTRSHPPLAGGSTPVS